MWKLCREVNINARDILKGIAKNLDTVTICVSTRPIQCCLNRNGLYEEPLFTNHVALLLGLVFPKRSWTKKIVFRYKYYWVMKEKFNFFSIMIHRTFGAKKRWSFLPKEHSTNIKPWRWLNEVFRLFTLKRVWFLCLISTLFRLFNAKSILLEEQ